MITIEEYFRELAKIALGRLKWPYREAMRANINAIILGYQGRMDELRMIYGAPEEEPAEELQPGMLRRAKFG